VISFSGENNFRNEIVWQRTNAHNMKSRYYGKVHDIILFYTKTAKYTWNDQYTEYSPEQLSRFKPDEKGRLYKAENLTFSSANPNRQFEWRGVRPPPNRSWGASLEQLEKWWDEGRILKRLDGAPRMDGMKVYLDDLKGKSLNDWWEDISRVGNTSSESLGYPTQKPVALLERIIEASSNEGDVVADFFCGCGTTIAAAQKLKRKWLGADISHLAIKLILSRLVSSYGPAIKDAVKLHGFPKDVDSAKMLARETDKGRFGFQEWAIEVLLHGVVNPKKTADGGYDGYLTYQTDKGKEFVLIETKSGNVNVKNMREFIQVIEKQKAAAGIFVCFEETVTRDMMKEAKAAGKIVIGEHKTDIDKIQILTVDDMVNNGKQPHLPNVISTFKQAERKETKSKTPTLFD
jgi:site-specific DNA-methyltransferase (adenine-specific)